MVEPVYDSHTTTSGRVTEILDDLARLRVDDAPTHGGRVLSYVYDSGLAELDDLARQAAASVQSINGLDPTTFVSVARMERDLIAFAAGLVHGDEAAGESGAVGLVTSGGTESCLLAVKSARDRWRSASSDGGASRGVRPRLLAPVSAHAAFHKAAHYFDLDLDLVPVGPDGTVAAATLIDAMSPDTALVVVSAPSYPFAALDPIGEVAAAAADRGIACHVDACIGGWVLPFWEPGEAPVSGNASVSGKSPTLGKSMPAWDFRVRGVTSLSMDAHKYGYAPKGTSVLLFADRDAKRAAGFTTTRWPGYPVVNPTMLGSRSAMSLAAAWAVVKYLGEKGFAELTDRARSATSRLRQCINEIDGLAVVGDPVGPLFAVTADVTVPAARRVDPHIWADQVRELGWTLQPQPGLHQRGGPNLAPTTHLTITPVTAIEVDALCAALTSAANSVRGIPAVDLSELVAALPELAETGALGSSAAHQLLASLGLGGDGSGSGAALPAQLAPVMALLEVIAPERAESLLAELLARLNET